MAMLHSEQIIQKSPIQQKQKNKTEKTMWKRSVSFFKPPAFWTKSLTLIWPHQKRCVLNGGASRTSGSQDGCMSVLGHISVMENPGKLNMTIAGKPNHEFHRCILQISWIFQRSEWFVSFFLREHLWVDRRWFNWRWCRLKVPRMIVMLQRFIFTKYKSTKIYLYIKK